MNKSSERVMNVCYENVALLRQPTRLQAAIHPRSQIRREMGPPGVDVIAPNRVRESKRSVDDIRREHPEVGGDIASAGVLVVESRNEDGRRAGRVLLVVDAAHREDRRLELPELCLDLRVEPILLHKARVENAIDDGQDLVRTGMRMRDVKPARLDERNGTGDAELLEDGEVVDCGEEDGAAAGAGGLVVEVKDCELTQGVTGEEISVRIGQQLLEAVDDAGLCPESGGDGSCIGDLRDGGGRGPAG